MWSGRMQAVMAAGLAVLACGASGAEGGPAPWAHRNSPFRAVFEVVSQPNTPKAGLAVVVPVCGLGHAEGTDLYAFSAEGEPLPSLCLGPGTANSALAVVEARPGLRQVHVYFGSRITSPQNRMAFVAPPLLTVRSFSQGNLTTWATVEPLLARERVLGRLFVDTISLTYNPVNSDDAFIMDFTGALFTPEGLETDLMLVSDDAGFLFVDDKLLIERGGSHRAHESQRGEARAAVKLTRGTHPVRCVVVEAGEAQAAVVGEFGDASRKWTLKPERFATPGKTRLTAVEGAGERAACPAFWYKPLSYISFNDRPYTEMEFGTHNRQPAAWQFDDGAKAEGATVRRVLPGLSPRAVTVGQGGTQAKGAIEFPEAAPPARSINTARDYEAYAALIRAERPDALDTAMLLEYLTFLEFHELSPDSLPICRTLVRRDNLAASGRQREVALLAARLAAGTDVPFAREAYLAALNACREQDELWPALVAEFAEFAILQAAEARQGEATVARLAARLGEADVRVRQLRTDLAPARPAPAAGKTAPPAAAASPAARDHAVRANALRESCRNLLADGFLSEARAALWDWRAVGEADAANGNWPLARARLFRRLGWHAAAHRVLAAAAQANELLPNLPDVEFEDAEVLSLLGQREEAAALYRKIVTQYPNHPLARQAEARLR